MPDGGKVPESAEVKLLEGNGLVFAEQCEGLDVLRPTTQRWSASQSRQWLLMTCW